MRRWRRVLERATGVLLNSFRSQPGLDFAFLLATPVELDEARVTKPSVTVRRSCARGRSYLFARERRLREREMSFVFFTARMREDASGSLKRPICRSPVRDSWPESIFIVVLAIVLCLTSSFTLIGCDKEDEKCISCGEILLYCRCLEGWLFVKLYVKMYGSKIFYLCYLASVGIE